MKLFLIDRHVPGAHLLEDAELQALARRSKAVLLELGPAIEWLHSYVSRDRITCIYRAEDAAHIREHAARGGFPADRVEPIGACIGPATAEGSDHG